MYAIRDKEDLTYWSTELGGFVIPIGEFECDTFFLKEAAEDHIKINKLEGFTEVVEVG